MSRIGRGRPGRVPGGAVLAASFLVGSVPFSGLAARAVAGVDLRHVGSGTVSGTSLYDVAGFAPLAVAGSLDVAKGAVGPWMAGPGRRGLGALAAGAAICGHNWSPFLNGAGGRGISPALGSLAVLAPEGAALLVGALAGGRVARQTGAAVFGALVGLVPLLGRRRGRTGVLTAACVVVPMVAKRLAGNRAPRAGATGHVLLWRLVLDRDPAPTGPGGAGGHTST